MARVVAVLDVVEMVLEGCFTFIELASKQCNIYPTPGSDQMMVTLISRFTVMATVHMTGTHSSSQKP